MRIETLIVTQTAAIRLHEERVSRLEERQVCNQTAIANLSMVTKVHTNTVELFELAVAIEDHAEASRWDAERKSSKEGVRKARAALREFPSVTDDLRAAKVQLNRARKELGRLQAEIKSETASLSHRPFQGLWAAVRPNKEASPPSAK